MHGSSLIKKMYRCVLIFCEHLHYDVNVLVFRIYATGGDSERRSAPTNENLWKTPALRENVRAKM